MTQSTSVEWRPNAASRYLPSDRFRGQGSVTRPVVPIGGGTSVVFQPNHVIPTGVATELSYFTDLAKYWVDGRPLYDHRNMNTNGRFLPSELRHGAQSTNNAVGVEVAAEALGLSSHANGEWHPKLQEQLKGNLGFGDLQERWRDTLLIYDRNSPEAKKVALESPSSKFLSPWNWL